METPATVQSFEAIIGRRMAAGSIREVQRRDGMAGWERRPQREPQRSHMMAAKAELGDSVALRLRTDLKGKKPVLQGLGARWQGDALEVDYGSRFDRGSWSPQPIKRYLFERTKSKIFGFDRGASLLYIYGEFLEEVPEDDE